MRTSSASRQGNLSELRKKEDEILKYLDQGIDYAGGSVTVIELVERYISLKQGVRHNTKIGYNFVLNLIKKENFGYRTIRDIKPSDAQRWFIKMNKDGRRYSTLCTVRGVLKPAFQMAYEEDVIRKNPFDFVITKYIENDSERRIALTPEEYTTWMDFIKNDKTYSKCYDEFVVLFGTGMRVSEFCGLTVNDLDFENKRIRVDHQILRDNKGRYYIEKTKTESGRRYIPMTNDVLEALNNILKKRPRMKKEFLIDGYSGFFLFDKNKNPKVALHIENEFRWALIKYRKLHPDKTLPHITPHVCRHTFCTNMAGAGMDPKVLQYIMGHSEIEVTMNVYISLQRESRSSTSTFRRTPRITTQEEVFLRWLVRDVAFLVTSRRRTSRLIVSSSLILVSESN